MDKKNYKKQRDRFFRMYPILGCFLVLAIFMFAVCSGIKYDEADSDKSYIAMNTTEGGDETEVAKEKKDCLLITDSRQENSNEGLKQFRQIFKDMKVDYDMIDIKDQIPSDFNSYKTVVLTLSELSPMGEKVLDLSDWVKAGGKVLFSQTLSYDSGFMIMQNKLGVQSSNGANNLVDTLAISDEFMIGGNTIAIDNAYNSALNVSLADDCTVYMKTGGEYPTPLVWQRNYGAGKFVVDNFGLCEKATRGFYAASYSLLEDVCIYPVIDASLFYIDDFPSPVPQGDGQYIRQFYNMTVSDFYTNIWWPDMIDISKRYGVKFTGMIIENYENQTSGELPVNSDTGRYHFFGDMLLTMGGELGIHGYNHQPLCLDNIDYEGEEDYKTWPTEKDMNNALTEVLRFSKDLFPNRNFATYVPPSNILSCEAREMIAKDFPEIKNIAGIYFSGEHGYEQEFEVAEDGMVEVPRIVSSCSLTDYMKMAAVSELNMHYVNSHFMHPDDLLDPDRGAALGWETLKSDYTEYLDWLFSSAPNIRSFTGSEGAGAVQRFYQLGVNRKDSEDRITLDLDNFVDDARLMVRVNNGEIGSVTGGELEHITGNLYLLTAKEAHVELIYK